MMSPSLVRSFTLGLGLLSSISLEAVTMAPGRIRNPPGLQFNMDVVYNPVRDEYLLAYSDGRALVGHLSPAGVFSNEIALSGASNVTHIVLAYNSVQNTFLAVWRTDGSSIFARYLSSDGNPIGNQFAIGSGGTIHVDFSTGSERYVIAWTTGTFDVLYKVVDGDSTSASPVLRSGVVSTGASLSEQIVYGSGSNKFLVVYVKDFAPNPRRSDVFGRFISSDGTTLGPVFAINTSTADQQKPVLGYAPSTDKWMVAYENWNCGGGCPHATAALINSAGAITNTFQMAATSGWDVPAAITYNPTTQTLIGAYRSAFANSQNAAMRQFSPVNGAVIGSPVLLSDGDPSPRSASARPDNADPQAIVLWREGNGLDGIYAGILHLDRPVPDTTAPAAVGNLRGGASAVGATASADVIASSGSDTATNVPANLLDGDTASYWSSPGRASIQNEFVTFDLGSATTLSSIRLLSRNAGGLFPLDYQIQVSGNNANFTTVFSATNMAPPPSTWVQHSLSSPVGRYVRIFVTRTRKSVVGSYKAQIAEVEIFEETALGGAVALNWTAPGDDGNSGTAAAYDLRWSLANITGTNFGSATQVPIPGPKPAGSAESANIGGLPSETRVFVALKTRDEASNFSPISNVIAVDTPGIAPAAIDDLTISSSTATSIRLNWTATGDNGNVGTADSYDLRISTTPINDSNFGDATPVLGVPNPTAAGTAQSFTVTGLSGETTYFFAMKVQDELGNTSGINTNGPVSGNTLDIVAPEQVTDLAAVPGAGGATRLTAPAIASSGDNSAMVAKEKATDGNVNSHWSSPPRATMVNEFLTVDTRSVHNIGRVRLRSRTQSTLFPVDIQIQVSNDNRSFTTVHAANGLPATAALWHNFNFASVSARYVRVLMTETRRAPDGYMAQIAEIEVYEVTAALGIMDVTFTAPGDSGSVGTAASYQLRWSLNNITNLNFGSANPIATGSPKPAGSLETFSVGGLPNETTVFFALKATDDSGNTSPLSNVASAATPGVSPAAIDDLAVSNPTASSLRLTWTAVGDDGTGGGAAQSYQLRRATSPITAANFGSATPVAGVPSPGSPGSSQTFTVTGLSSETTYYFAIRVMDDVGNLSPINSNGPVSGQTLDESPPAAVTNLAAAPGSGAGVRLTAPAIAASSINSPSVDFSRTTDGDPNTHWSSIARPTMQTEFITMDTRSVNDISQVRLLSRNQSLLMPENVQIQVSGNNVNFTTVHTALGLPSTPGTWSTLNFPTASGRYVRILMTKTRLGAGGYMAQIAEIEVYRPGVNNQVLLSWTAPGDDGNVGTAASYDLRRSTSPITASNFGSATPVAGEPAPQPAGSPQSFTVTGLAPGTYYFALKTEDDSGNVSLISNVVNETLP